MSAPLEPHREVGPARAVTASRIGHGAVFCAGALLPVVVVLTLQPDDLIERYPIPLPIADAPVAPAPPPPPPTVHHVGCTIPLSQIGLVDLPRHLGTVAPASLQGVAATPTGCSIAAWTARVAYVSRDDGASFARLGGTDPIDDLAITPDGTVAILRGGRIDLEHSDDTRVSRRVPASGYDAIYASGRWLVLRSHDQLAASDDGGVTWKTQAAPPAVVAAIRADDDGTLHLAVATTRDAPVTYYRGSAGGGAWQAIWTSPPADLPSWSSTMPSYSIDGFAFGTDGKLYAGRYGAHGMHVFAVSASGTVTDATRLPPEPVLRGVAIRIPARRAPDVARDAHGLLLTLIEGRGPVRVSDNVADVLPPFLQSNGGRWLVGNFLP